MGTWTSCESMSCAKPPVCGSETDKTIKPYQITIFWLEDPKERGRLI